MTELLYGEKMIAENRLEAIPNPNPERPYWIDFVAPEFTCLCPRSGFPDFATISISYVPDQYCVELKSLKLYINSYRNQKIFHEAVINKIADDLIALLDPRQIEVRGEFNVRGNIKSTVRVSHTKPQSH
ncbi:MAG: NADPH-dependent 7-cyano-7-deazaguanine reductase QueF [Deltaproteobacteria bacterium]|nr:NADPH-dependent 7-cyano-7-deazaguanine reductase QueF [Deltaproteobacteria bacterium]